MTTAEQQILKFLFMQSPVGRLQLVADEHALVGVLWECETENRVKLGQMIEDQQDPLLLNAKTQLLEYFEGHRKTFDLPLSFKGTVFQMKVWDALLSIPYGETRTYKEIAIQIGNSKAVRAVGSANRRNPLSILAPCHRVIGASGKLVGFAGGLDKKQILLQLEQTA